MEQALQTDTPTARVRKTRNAVQMATDITIKALLSQGLTNRKIGAMLKCSPNTVQRVRDDMKDAGQDPQALVSASRNELLGKVYDRFMEKGLKIQKVKASDVVAVAKDYRSVAFPSRQEGGGDTFSFVQINMAAAAPSTTTCSELGDGKTVDAEFVNEIKDSRVG